jgi:hypothetical protein
VGLKAYVITTATLFALVFIAHVWRAVEEGAPLSMNPTFIALTVIAAALAVWAFRVLKSMPRT